MVYLRNGAPGTLDTADLEPGAAMSAWQLYPDRDSRGTGIPVEVVCFGVTGSESGCPLSKSPLDQAKCGRVTQNPSLRLGRYLLDRPLLGHLLDYASCYGRAGIT